MRNNDMDTSFIDLLYGIIALLTSMLCVMFLVINDPNQKENVGVKSPGDLIVTASWTEGPTDVDLWVLGPGEKTPIGFSNRAGLLWNLLRDDLGTAGDTLPFNYENAYTRGIPDGDYTVNVYCYRCIGSVDVYVSLEQKVGSSTQFILGEKYTLKGTNDWRTMLGFKVKNQKVISTNKVQKELWGR